MDELAALEARLSAALEILERAAPPAAPAPDASLAELEEENRALAARLDTLTQAREDDLAQIDRLIDQLKPLVEEAV